MRAPVFTVYTEDLLIGVPIVRISAAGSSFNTTRVRAAAVPRCLVITEPVTMTVSGIGMGR
ncbi:hypothetical protein [Actinomadura formosensis]|uniref:hypothetical protein n=1 Tax=Actinomadura formosensis TaxID=60706 RepID=UPI00104177E1|nr:hypothetical protein [Actinomadura formosensis]